MDPEDWEDDIVFCDYQGGYAKLVGTTLMRPLMIGVRKFQLSPRLDNFTPPTQRIITQSNSQRGVKFSCIIDDWCLFDDCLGLAVNRWRVTQVHERSWVTAHEPWHQEIVETLVFPVRSDHVMDPWGLMFNTYKALASIIRPASGLQGIVIIRNTDYIFYWIAFL